jgi:2-methylcitrate dehydratase PrpD
MATVTEQLSEISAGLVTASLDDAVLHATRRVVVDWFATTIPGAVEAPATLLRAGLADELGHGRAQLLFDGVAAPARTAALINGAASHTIEFDDIYKPGIYHPGSPVIAAVLALAQSEGADGERFLRGVLAGYELSNRIAEAVQPSHYKFWHTTGTIGTLGAAAGAAAVLGLDPVRTAHAVATAATFAAGLQQAFRADAMTKPLHAGHAADAGIMAALGAREGVTGALDILEGPVGFGSAMTGGVDWDDAIARMKSGYTMLQITQKNHTCCGHTFAAVDGVIALARDNGLTADNVAKIRIRTYGKALEVCASNEPASPYQARFSLSYCAAAALVVGSCRLSAFTPERLSDPVLRDVMTRVEASIDEEADAVFPSRRSAHVEIEGTDGQIYRHYSPNRRGDPEDPLSDGEVTDKLLDLATPLIGKEATDRLSERLWSLGGGDDMSSLFEGREKAA